MPSTTDRPDGSDDPFAVAEAAHVAARETVPVDRTRPERPPSEPVDRSRSERPPGDPGQRSRSERPPGDPGQRSRSERPPGDPGQRSRSERPPGDPGERSRSERPPGDPGERAASHRPSPDPVERPTEPVSIRSATPGVPRERRPADTRPEIRETRPLDADELAAARHDTLLVDDRVLGRRETVKVPGQRPPAARPSRAPLPVAAAFATLWAALLSYLPVAAVIGLARTLEGAGGLGGAAHAGLAGWLLGHGVPIGTSIGALGLAPLLLTLLIVGRLNRAGLHVTRAIGARHSGSVGDALLVAFAIGLTYSLLGSLAGLAVDAPHTEVSSGRAAINFFLLGFAAALFGSLRGTDALSVL